jgi:hypothetical protein
VNAQNALTDSVLAKCTVYDKYMYAHPFVGDLRTTTKRVNTQTPLLLTLEARMCLEPVDR